MDTINRLKPEECTGMSDIRAELDALDKVIIALIGKRYPYVMAASRFKTSETDVRAPERVRTMMLQRRAWAEAEGLSPDVIEKMYRDLVVYFTEEELQRWKTEQTQD